MKVLYLIPGKEKGSSFIFSRREYALLKREYLNDIEVYFLNTRDGFISLVKSILEARSIIIKHDIEIIHAQYGSFTAFLAVIMGWRKKVVITYRGSDINGSDDINCLRRATAKMLSWWGMHFADSVIFVSPALRNVSPNLFKRSQIIPSGVDTKSFFSIDKKSSKERLRLASSKKYLLFYSSNGSLNKRPDLAFGALKKLHELGFPEFEILEVRGGIAPDEMPYYINSCDATLMLSNKEGSPTIVQESLVCGVPVVSVNVGDTTDMLKEISNSIIVERNIDDIANGILKVTRIGKIVPNESLISKISLSGCTNRIYNLYGELMGEDTYRYSAAKKKRL